MLMRPNNRALETAVDWVKSPRMTLAVYNLLGALFAPPDSPSLSSGHANKLFMRIRGLIKGRFADPDFGPMRRAFWIAGSC